MGSSWLILGVILLSSQVVRNQRVRVLPEVEAYPNESVNLRCEFTNPGSTKLTQVSWIFEATEGHRENIAVFHPMYGESFPKSAFKGRVQFIQASLEYPSIRIDSVKMSDAGRYTCEYATYPSGNEQGTTTLIMLAKPKNSATPVVVQTGSAKVVVARCEALQGKPAATITWVTGAMGEYNSTSQAESDGTVTVKSEYRMAPASTDNGRDITCMISQHTQDRPQTFPMKLVVQYPPTVRIEGYDNNWYMGRTDASLTCHADANPKVVNVTWTTVLGNLPATAKVDQNRLLVQKVDESVNTTFICEAKNSLGSGKSQLTAAVIELTGDPSSAGVLVGAILGSLLALLLACALITVLVIRSRRPQPHYAGDSDQGTYSNKARIFGVKKASKNGTRDNNNGPIYMYRESEPGALAEKGNEFLHAPAGMPAPHHIPLTCELDEAGQRKFDTLNDSMEEEEEEEEQYDGFGGLPPSYHIPQCEDDYGVYIDDDMESQRDGSIISRTAIYV
ncbi:PVR cell adhesion molecule related 2 like isoform X1 [Colossoma macropomum]|uniref:PVR cell adhesion molecule related 2 like isoform X1 n=1 Tax=Colossoma macropomum TaxID=42526 RepID=UPI001864B121|nr:PVR cell adhesion molecule related 2 like isoform X1 [Colossoma macropomum]